MRRGGGEGERGIISSFYIASFCIVVCMCCVCVCVNVYACAI